MKKKNASKKIMPMDFSGWNFVIFLTLSLILIVFVAMTVSNQMHVLRARAGRSCPDISTLPRPEDCPGGSWKFYRDANGCQQFMCPTR